MANLRCVKSGARGGGGAGGDRTPLAAGTKVIEISSGREGVVLEHACQYAHPQAAAVFQYLLRWEDGHVEAISETAFRAGAGLVVVDPTD